MSEAAIAKKSAIVDEVSAKFSAAASVVVVDYRGLTVDEVTRLRKQLRDANVEMKVIKNSILSRAAEKAGLEGLGEVFTGPTAVAFSNEDVVAPAKIIALAKLPNREGLLSMLLSVLQAPIRNVAYAVKAVAEKEEDAA